MLNDLRRRLDNWLTYRHTVEILRHANDSMLADVGINRYEIRRRAHDAVYRGDK